MIIKSNPILYPLIFLGAAFAIWMLSLVATIKVAYPLIIFFTVAFVVACIITCVFHYNVIIYDGLSISFKKMKYFEKVFNVKDIVSISIDERNEYNVHFKKDSVKLLITGKNDEQLNRMFYDIIENNPDMDIEIKGKGYENWFLPKVTELKRKRNGIK